MPNMSYCKFQNTLKDLQDCCDDIYNDDLSTEEDKARKRLVKLCRDIAADADAGDIPGVDGE